MTAHTYTLALLAAAVATSACGATAASSHRTADGVVRFIGEPADVTIWVDGRFIAPLRYARGGVALAPGPHQIELRADAYLSKFLEINTQAGSKVDIAFALDPELP
ncbi:MAG: hypothetical protein KBG15_03935 [Kofleriaceae bacterium]|nr:hypothetical protein [Kofleriaceae bacterium]